MRHLPVIVFLAVDASVLTKTGELRLQIEFARAAFQASHVPLLIYGQQVIAVGYFPLAARTKSHTLTAHRRHVLRTNATYWFSKDRAQTVRMHILQP